jgi:hypothetical protein
MSGDGRPSRRRRRVLNAAVQARAQRRPSRARIEGGDGRGQEGDRAHWPAAPESVPIVEQSVQKT